MRRTTRVPDPAFRLRPVYRLLFGVFLSFGLGRPSVAEEVGHWRATAEDGELGFELNWEGERLIGRFRQFEVEIDFLPVRPRAARFAARVTLDSVDLGNPDLDQTLAEPLWFDTGHFPEARFHAVSAQRLSGGVYRLRGVLSLKGRERPVELNFTWTPDGKRARLLGGAELDRREFGVGEGEWLTDSTVSFPVRVRFDLSLRRRVVDGRD
jgi:polyisoprenoid-binding protein YceI